jgi:hypothetical protein
VFINNLNINIRVNVILTNFVTGQVLSYQNIGYGTPWGLPDGWCGACNAGDWHWSVGYGNQFYGAGVFHVGIGGAYIPYVPPLQPLVIYYQGYQPYVVNNYYLDQGCGCVYANGLYYRYQQPPQWVTLPGQTRPQYVVTPTAYSPTPVTQQFTEGVPPLFYGTGKSPSYWWLMWLGIGVAIVAGAAAGGTWWWEREHQDEDSLSGEPDVPALT